jgi:hypothetical protein
MSDILVHSTKKSIIKELEGTDPIYVRTIGGIIQTFDSKDKKQALVALIQQLEKARKVGENHIKDIENKSTKEEQIEAMAAYVKIYRDGIEGCQRQIEEFKDILEILVDYRHDHDLYRTKANIEK